jgi:DNA adenine methylase
MKKKIQKKTVKKLPKQDIISEFPEDYKDLIYCEPFCGCCSVFLKKEPSRINVLNDSNLGIYTLIKTLQNNENHFFNKLKKIKLNKSIFKKEIDKKSFKNENEHAINQYIIHRMSRAGLCKTYSWSVSKKNQGDLCSWNTNIDSLQKISEKLYGVFLYNKSPREIVENFNCHDVLLYCNMPCYCGNKSIKTAYKTDMDEKDHTEFSKLLLKFSGKVVVHNLDSSLYKKLYNNFNKKKIINKNKTEYIWKNF